AAVTARARGGRVCSVDKANVLDVSGLWRAVVNEVARDYPDVELEHALVDSCALRLITDPASFDVLVTENTFGDILSDVSAGIGGSLGLLPSASLGDGSAALYEPVHGSAPDIAGQDRANPMAAILSVAMLLRHSADAPAAALAVERAVEAVLGEGYRTADLVLPEGGCMVGTQAFGSAVARTAARFLEHKQAPA
ncbi:MAG: isocitrate/isopropylmalate family dehydrogenase, partial [Planctomycetota bacterium]|nr:isocitrate/isopropylmalate family dehydrogenase [Planctomycetota bacterium]